MVKPLPDYDYLHKILRYDPETGKLFWRERDDRNAAWNSRWGGKEAFTCVQPTGHKIGMINGKHYLAHRVVWKLTHRNEPPNQIDHVNGNGSDNRVCNLRAANHKLNMQNKACYKNSPSGVSGVTWYKPREMWVARIGLNGTKKTLGYFDNFEDACYARKQAEQKFGFHPNHGRRIS